MYNSKNQDQFYTDAMALISDDQQTRISPITKAVIDRGNFIFDAHCHVFDGECINLRYLVARMVGGLRIDLYTKILSILTGVIFKIEKSGEQIDSSDNSFESELLLLEDDPNYLEVLAERIKAAEFELDLNTKGSHSSHFQLRVFLRKWRVIVNLLRTGKMSDVYEQFRDHFAVTTVYNGQKELLTIVLGMDLDKGWEGKVKKSNHDQIRELGELANSYPVLPFLPLDPRRADDTGVDNLYEIFLNAFKRDSGSNYFGVKVYPALGYLPSDERLKMIFRICAAKNIPVVSHCGGEMISTFERSITVNRHGIEDKIEDFFRTKRAARLNEPGEWKSVLEDVNECFKTTSKKKLFLNLGHFGSGKAWGKPHSSKAARKEVIFKLMEDHNVFADFSFNIEELENSDAFVKVFVSTKANGELTREAALMHQRSLFGTDFWVVLPKSVLSRDQKYFLDKLGVHSKKLLVDNVMKFLQLDDMQPRIEVNLE